jgi:hypothetical protein
VRRAEHLRRLASDYPLALRLRRESLRDPAVPPGFDVGDRRPVVIVPGVYETWHFLRAIAERLSATGHPVHVLPELGINAAPIPTSADMVAAALAGRGLSGVALVAHSKGGLIGKRAMLQDREGRIDRLVTVATPFGGSRMARYTLLPSLRTFHPRNAVIRTLAGERAVNARITSIYPAFDPHIPEGSRLEGATNVEIPVSGHFRILLDPRAAEAVVVAVERPFSA